MVVFARFKYLRKSLLFCAATGILLTKLSNYENDIDKETLKSTIDKADLICQSFKEKQCIPGKTYRYKINHPNLYFHDKQKGVSIGVTMHGSFVWKKGFGLADIEQRVPCTPETVMRIASISKTFTTTIAGQLFEKGKFKWDDTIDKHHKDLPNFLFENVPSSITIRQLASHTR